MVENDEYSKDGEIYREVFESNEDKENTEETNIVKIAGRRIEIYNQTILYKFQKFDQIEICVFDTYLERALQIIKQWEALGITPTSQYRTKNGSIKFEKREEDITTKEGKKFKKPVNRITLTKQPDQFRFTEV